MLLNTYLIYGSGIVAALLIVGGILFVVNRIRERHRIQKALGFVLYELTFSEEDAGNNETSAKDLISVMEQFYSGMGSIVQSKGLLRSENNYYALELALPNAESETTFYVAVEKRHRRIFEKQIESLFPHAHVVVRKEDYNIFNAEGESVACEVRLKENIALPIRTYQRLEADPLEVIANAFSKLKKEGEGAALQILVEHADPSFQKKIKSAQKQVKQGKSVGSEHSGGWGDEFFHAINVLVGGGPSRKKNETDESPQRSVNEDVVELIDEKLSSPLFKVNIRLVASGSTKDEARAIVNELESALLQFAEPQGNQFVCAEVSDSRLSSMLYKFSFRLFDEARAIYLNARELTSVFHFPSGTLSAPRLKTMKAKSAPAPAQISEEGVLIGTNVYRGEKTEVRMALNDRRRHTYMIGQTGTGKTELLKNMAVQDIKAGHGLCVIDPHGDMAESLLGAIPEERVGDVVYFNPGNVDMPMGLNFLEYDSRFPEQKTFVVDELLQIFNKLYNMELAGGPMFEQYFRNATHLVLEDPASGSTLLEVVRVLTDPEFRNYKLSRSKNPVVNAFWKDVAEKTGGEHALQNMVPYITSKFDTFLSNEIMRPIIAQQTSSFRMRDIMDERKILIVNLSKGRLGEANSALLGLIIVGKILMATFSRASEADESKRSDFFLYIDEFQSVTTQSIATILSEARKYRLNLVVAHQFVGQLTDEIRKSVFGNVGNTISFRIGREDAEVLEKQFEPVFSAHDLANIENFQAYVKMLINGQTAKPFNVQTPQPIQANEVAAEAIKELSSQTYGRQRAEVEQNIAKRYE